MSPAQKAKWSLATMLSAATLLTMVGGFLGATIAWTGGKLVSPDRRIANVEAAVMKRNETVDSMFIASEERDSALHFRVKQIEQSLSILVVLRCLEPDPVARAAVMTAQVPCARIIRDKGMFQP